jgi:hypothetical protein
MKTNGLESKVVKNKELTRSAEFAADMPAIFMHHPPTPPILAKVFIRNGLAF